MKISENVLLLVNESDGFAATIADALNPHPNTPLRKLEEEIKLPLDKHGVKEDIGPSGSIVHFIDQNGVYQISIILLRSYEPPLLEHVMKELLQLITSESEELITSESEALTLPVIVAPFLVAASKLKFNNAKAGIQCVQVCPDPETETSRLFARIDKPPLSTHIQHERLSCLLHVARAKSLPTSILIGQRSSSTSSQTQAEELQVIHEIGELVSSWSKLHFSKDKVKWNASNKTKEEESPWRALYGFDVAEEVISMYFKEQNSLVRHQLDSFDNFLSQTLQHTISQHPPIVIVSKRGVHTHTVSFGKVRLDPPSITEADGYKHLLLPKEARLRSCSYASSMYLDITVEKVEEETTSSLQLFIGKVPIMLRSVKCLLHGKGRAELIKAGENEHDPGGYFIINGLERVILAQERLAKNRIYVHQNKQPNKYEYVAQIHSVGVNKTRSAYVRLLKSKGCIRCTLPFIKKSDFPVVLVFRALGISTAKEIVQLVCYDDDDTEMKELFWPSLTEAENFGTQQAALEYIGKWKEGATDPEDKEIYARNILKKEFLPHVGVGVDDNKKKAYFLGYIIHRLLLCVLRRRPVDDREHLGNKRLDLAGPLFAELFRKLFRNLTARITDHVQKRANHSKEVELERAIMAKTITDGFSYALATGNWGSGYDSKNRVGVSQVLDRLTYLSTLSHLRRATSSLKPEEKWVRKPRQLHASQWGMMCPVETPTRDSCGLVKNMACMSDITVGSDPTPITDYLKTVGLKDLKDLESTDLSSDTKVFVNGEWVGSMTESLPNLVPLLKNFIKRNCDLYTSVIGHSSLKEVWINTDSGRCTRPLFRVVNQRLLIEEKAVKELKEMKTGAWIKLLEEGLVEYIDAEEEEKTMISVSIENLTKERNYCDTYTHCEIHPSLILGVSASIIPFPNHNQPVRNTYQSAMGKQAIGTYVVTNFQSRMDTCSSILCYPQRPLVKTSMMKHLGLEELPAGINAVVAISCHGGYNQGDAIVMNRSSIDRGFFRSISFRTYKDMESAERTFGQPTSKEFYLEDDGLPFLGARGIESVIIGISQDDERKSLSMKRQRGDTGIVDQVMLTNDEKTGSRFVKVKTRMNRTPEIGDKFSSRHGQKGVIGMTTPQEDMPWTREGITPDIIINPHSIPSRMTVGQFLESLMGKKLAAAGEIKHIVPFAEVTADSIGKELHKYAYQKKGLERMYNGDTGRPIASMIFVGPVFYQRLNHLVGDKIQSRSRGPIEPLTRQPNKGRCNWGGQRVGEMERDCLISHGVSLNLKERLFCLSDPYRAHVCQRCGFTGYTKGNAFICKFCKNSGFVVEVDIPYAFKLLTQELLAAGIRLTLQTEKKL